MSRSYVVFLVVVIVALVGKTHADASLSLAVTASFKVDFEALDLTDPGVTTVVLDNGEFTGCGIGQIDLAQGGSLIIEGSGTTSINCEDNALSFALFFCSTACDVTLQDLVITRLASKGALKISTTGSSLTLANFVVTASTFDAMLSVDSNAILSATDVEVSSSTGDAITSLGANVAMTITGLSCASLTNGVCVSVLGGTASIQNANSSDSTHSTTTTLLYAAANTQVNLNTSTCARNQGTLAACVYATTATSVSIDGLSMEDYSGAPALVLEAVDAVILANVSASGGAVGDIGIDGATTITMQSVVCINSTAVSEPVVSIQSSTSVVMTSCSIINAATALTALSLFDVADVSLDSCDFENCVASSSNGGAISIEALPSTALTVDISQCNFVNNQASGGGGAVNITSDEGLITISNTVFVDNTAEGGEGGALALSAPSTSASVNAREVLLNMLTVQGNVAATNGGGIAFLSFHNVVVNDGDFSLNSAGSSGGGIYVSDTAITVECTTCTFSLNSAGDGGGGANIAETSAFNCTNCEFADNSAASGAGLATASGAQLSGCTFTANTATGDGGALLSSVGDLTVDNSAFAGNDAGVDGAALHLSCGAAVLIDVDVTSGSGTSIIEGLGVNLTVSGGTMTDVAADMLLHLADFMACSSDLAIEGTNFSRNIVSGDALLSFDMALRGTILSSSFDSNEVNSGLGFIFKSSGEMPSVSQCTFTANTAAVFECTALSNITVVSSTVDGLSGCAAANCSILDDPNDFCNDDMTSSSSTMSSFTNFTSSFNSSSFSSSFNSSSFSSSFNSSSFSSSFNSSSFSSSFNSSTASSSFNSSSFSSSFNTSSSTFNSTFTSFTTFTSSGMNTSSLTNSSMVTNITTTTTEVALITADEDDYFLVYVIGGSVAAFILLVIGVLVLIIWCTRSEKKIEEQVDIVDLFDSYEYSYEYEYEL